MGQESVAWVLIYIAAFGLSDTLVAISTSNPGHPALLGYYGVMGLGGVLMLLRGNHGLTMCLACARQRLSRSQPAALCTVDRGETSV
tara:strand:+ start:229 stop:489 length:261 start_codon:yes stop_codon:yes gene_type:complete